MKKVALLAGVFLFCISPFLTQAAITQSSDSLGECVLMGFAISELDARDEFNRPIETSNNLFDLGQTLKVLRLVLGSEPLLFMAGLGKGALYFSDQPVLPPLARMAFNIPVHSQWIRDISLILPTNRNRFSLFFSVNPINSPQISSAEKIPTDLSSSDSPQKFEVLRL